MAKSFTTQSFPELASLSTLAHDGGLLALPSFVAWLLVVLPFTGLKWRS